jgi:hypothetical protein
VPLNQDFGNKFKKGKSAVLWRLKNNYNNFKSFNNKSKVNTPNIDPYFILMDELSMFNFLNLMLSYN